MKPEMKVVAMNMRFPDFFPVIESDLTQNIIPGMPRYDINDEYKLRCEIGVRFYANNASLDSATEAAMQRIMLTLYSDAIAKLRDTQNLIYKGDKNGALAMIDDIVMKMSGVK